MKYLAITTLLLAVLLCSCTHYYYVPNIQNVPLLREKDEFHFSGSYAEGDESRCFEAQTAYSVSKNIGLMANYMHAWGGEVSDNNYGRGHYIEGAIGYFKPIEDYGVFEIYGGFGSSKQHHEITSPTYDPIAGITHTIYNGNTDVSFTKLFIQPSFGVTFNFIDLAVSTRFYSVSYNKIKNHIVGNSDEYNFPTNLSGKSHLFLEPAVTARLGWKNLKFQSQLSYAWYLSNSSFWFHEEWHFSVGLYLTIANRMKPNVAGTF
jgi:hypothetical protein